MHENFKKFTMLEDQPTTASDSTGNTDGEDTESESGFDYLMRKAGEQVDNVIIKDLRKELASLREQLKQRDKELERLNNDLLDALDLKNGNGPTALSMLSEKLKQKEDENRELVQSIKEMVPILESALTSAKYGYDSKEYCAELELLIKKANNLSA